MAPATKCKPGAKALVDLRPGVAQVGRPRGDPGLGGGQAAVGEQGEALTVGDERDQGVQAGQQPLFGDGTGAGLPHRPVGSCLLGTVPGAMRPG